GWGRGAQGKHASDPRGEAPIRMLRPLRAQLLRERGDDALPRVHAGFLEQRRGFRQRRLLWTARPPRRLAQDDRPFEQLARHVLRRADLLGEACAPALEAIDPPFDRELVRRVIARSELRAPAAVAERGHRYLLPLGVAGPPPHQDDRQLVMAVCEDVRLDDDILADGAFRRIASLVHLWSDAFDDDASLQTGIQG